MPSVHDGPLSATRALRESLPIAAITLAWVVVSWLAGHPLVGTGARYAGVVMAGAYALARGVALARESNGVGGFAVRPDGDATGDAWLLATRVVPPDVLHGNLVAVLAGGAWLLAARLVLALGGIWDGLGLPGLFRSPAPGLGFALTSTGVLTVLLAAVAVTLARVRAGGGVAGDAAGSEPPSGGR